MTTKRKTEIGGSLCYFLRHRPEEAELIMDTYGRVKIDNLLHGLSLHDINISREELMDIINTDDKKRYEYDAGRDTIRCYQGHSIPWVIVASDFRKPPYYLYHGTTELAWEKIQKSGHIDKMSRHAVHMYSDKTMATNRANRHKAKPVVLEIAAGEMIKDGYEFSVTDNDVWLIESVPLQYVRLV